MKIKKILPRAEQILIIPEPEESRVTASGLIKPETVEQERKSFGVVKATGSKIKDIKVGDIVIFASLAGDEIEVEIGKEKVEYRILYDDEVLATIIEK